MRNKAELLSSLLQPEASPSQGILENVIASARKKCFLNASLGLGF